MKVLRKFIKDQLSVWPMAAANFRALKTIRTKSLTVGGLACKVQFNPSRVASSTADTSPEVISARPCFLCVANRPPEQSHIKFDGRKGRRYNIQVNPFPIFPGHLVIAREEHIPQSIWHHMPDMLEFALNYPDWTVFYNGPKSGASAPDHLHFQAVPRGMMPLEREIDSYLDNPGDVLATNRDASLYHFGPFARGIFAMKAPTAKSLTKLFYRLLCCCSAVETEVEPPFNLYVWRREGEFRSFVVFRRAVRSHHYHSTGPDHLSISPGAADMAGVFVAPFEEDLKKVTAGMLEEMLDEVCISSESESAIIRRLTRTQPRIEVGIMSAEEIRFEIISDGAGLQKVSFRDGRINYNGVLYDELVFDSVTRSTLFSEPSFILQDVIIGIGFHWERSRTLKFAGRLKFIVYDGKVVAVNIIGLEDYLLSVISSEMKSSAGLELLKAHAVISRSWALRRIRDRREGNAPVHEVFDVCADDCCQRYQGLTMAAGDNVRYAIDGTWGEVLEYGGGICDARYSKCCGGRSERFSTCWDGPDLPYLSSVPDRPSPEERDFCDCEDSSILSQVLNDYDLETRDFYRWRVRYTLEEISAIIRERTGRDIGTLQRLEPLERGDSGRISLLRIVGSGGSFKIGKELAIRKALSRNCLKSSDFESLVEDGTLVLEGRGWGHGAGLCQIGAAVMASRGYSYREILTHYYTGSDISNYYD